MSYVALGDSYASGEGLPPYEGGTDGCRRSARGYPALLAARTGRFLGGRSAACSGAVTGDVLASQVSALREDTRTVTLTVGGNDAGFASVVASCLRSPDPRLQAVLDQGGGTWRRRLRSEAEQQIAYLGGPAAAPRGRSVPFVRVLAEIARRSPGAEILVTGYPRLLGARPSTAGHRAAESLPLFVGPEDAAWLTRQSEALDRALQTGVERASATGVRARFVDVVEAFAGHGLSDTGPAWVNGVMLSSPASLVPDSSSLHLSAEGQAAYAAAISAAAPEPL